MCQLMGMSANVPTDICFSFTGLIQRGGVTGPHRDGWGIAFYEGRGCRFFHDQYAGCESQIAGLVKEFPIKSHIVISHIRKANRGRICLENTHPFVRELWGCYWSFAHNGQLKGIKKKSLTHYHPVGSTDSEYAFCWMLDQIKDKFPKKPESKVKLKGFINQLSDQLAERGIFNMLLSDSVYLYTYCSTKLCWITRKAPFGEAELKDVEMKVNFCHQTTPKDIVSVVATEQLTNNEKWVQMSKGDFLVFKNGLSTV
ncbi:MAG: class II glutamine amidotransferase [Deltaproteobacteria bacterium]|nr:class II glutamine amidotransferase [Deltaproteobacteria bacterium]